MPDLDYAKLVGRLGLTVADGPDEDDTPDTVWCDEGIVRITPQITYTKIAGATPSPWTAGHAVIDATIAEDGYIWHNDSAGVWLVDLTSDKVNPHIADDKATHKIEFIGVKADGTDVAFPPVFVRITGPGVCDLTTISPVPTASPVPIVRGETGAGVQSAAIEAGDLILELDDGTEVNAGELPVGPGGSDAGVASYVETPGSATKTALAATFVRRTAVLAPWFKTLRETPAAAKIALKGDSTYDIGAAGFGFHAQIKRHFGIGRALEGMVDANVLNYGYNGQTTAQVMSDAHLALLAADAPSLVIAGPGINDIRTRTLTNRTADVAWLRAILVAGFNKLRAAVPGVPVIASIPNSFTTTSGGQVTGDPQECSAILREAYLSLTDEWPDVLVDDTQEHVFGITSLATSIYMSDQIHPSSLGYAAKVDHLMTIIGLPLARATGRSAAAVVAAPYTPWTSYSRDVEDTDRYTLVGEWDYQNQGTTFIDFALPAAQRTIVQRGDLIQVVGGGVTFMVPTTGTFTANANGSFSRFLFTSGVIPATTPAVGTKVRVWRQRYGGDAALESVLRAPARFKRSFRVVSATGTAVTLVPVSRTAANETTPAADLAAIIVAGNQLYIEGDAANPRTLGSGEWSVSGSNLVVAGLSTDYSTYVGRLAVITGTQADAPPGTAGAVGPASKTGNSTVSGRDILPVIYGGLTSAAGVNGTEYAVPFAFSEAASITHIAIEAAAAVAGAVARLGLRATVSGLPDTLLVDAGVVDCSTTGIKVIALATPVAVAAGTVIWAVCREAGTAAPNIKTVTGPSPHVSMRGGVAGELGTASYAATRTTSDAALLTNFSSTTPSNHGPMVRLRVA